MDIEILKFHHQSLHNGQQPMAAVLGNMNIQSDTPWKDFTILKKDIILKRFWYLKKDFSI